MDMEFEMQMQKIEILSIGVCFISKKNCLKNYPKSQKL
uniref:Uncharacterized protein n=1 Tax=Wuchereria bancrofti TaxID=6293 RepID=A0AAF5RW17_WUCBA